jgi:hypothetical protein
MVTATGISSEWFISPGTGASGGVSCMHPQLNTADAMMITIMSMNPWCRRPFGRAASAIWCIRGFCVHIPSVSFYSWFLFIKGWVVRMQFFF